VQLPPEYDPYRRYPCILALHADGATPANALDWWAGAFNERLNSRAGQATRQGYIVITPQWTREHQRSYEYSAREHAAVMLPLRHAMQRFAIDSDRVYLAGHSMGGDAAWDIGIAHPDLWAGVIPITANADKFVTLYTDNARYVPWYFVVGEKDGQRDLGNNVQWDRYLSRAGYDVMITEYLGRGHDHYYDDIQRIFEWMKLHQRNFFPRKFEVASMRSIDDFFWWTEVSDFPSQQIVSAFNWPPPKNTPPLKIESEILPNNGVRLSTGAKKGYIYLSPDMVDFEKKVVINGSPVKALVPSAEVLLEDVRTRGDRRHPFWVKVDYK
jgi:predicted esterase